MLFRQLSVWPQLGLMRRVSEFVMTQKLQKLTHYSDDFLLGCKTLLKHILSNYLDKRKDLQMIAETGERAKRASLEEDDFTSNGYREIAADGYILH